MKKMKFITLAITLTLLSIATTSFAIDASGDYCNGGLRIRLLSGRPDPANNTTGTLSVFWAQDNDRSCMGPSRVYHLTNNKLVDVNGLQADVTSTDSISVTAPANWAGEWKKSNCVGTYPDPCK